MKQINALVKSLVPSFALKAKRTFTSLQPIAKRHCNICGYKGWFDRFGRPPRLDAECPKCKSLERHRLLDLVIERNLLPINLNTEGLRILHFAPESIFEKKFRSRYRNYQTADLFAKADLTLNLEEIDLSDKSVDVIIANHVLEHVDDAKAAAELNRILAPGGILICMVPIVEGWDDTYENTAVSTAEDRWLHFGQYDHVRYYGRDFRDRIKEHGYSSPTEFTAEGEDVIKYGLMRGEKVFVFQKPQ